MDIPESPNLALYEDTKYNNGSILYYVTGIPETPTIAI